MYGGPPLEDQEGLPWMLSECWGANRRVLEAVWLPQQTALWEGPVSQRYWEEEHE